MIDQKTSKFVSLIHNQANQILIYGHQIDIGFIIIA